MTPKPMEPISASWPSPSTNSAEAVMMDGVDSMTDTGLMGMGLVVCCNDDCHCQSHGWKCHVQS